MTSLNQSIRRRAGLTLIEFIVAMGVFGIFASALLTSWASLQFSALNTTAYAERQNDQMRVIDYLKRDIRRASGIEIYSGATLVTGTGSGGELRLTIPDYYADSREEDDAIGTKVPNTPALVSGSASYGATMTVRYYTGASGVIRNEAGTIRPVAAAAGAFTLSFNRETSGEIRCRIIFNQAMRGKGSRNLRRQVDIVCGQRTQLQL